MKENGHGYSIHTIKFLGQILLYLNLFEIFPVSPVRLLDAAGRWICRTSDSETSWVDYFVKIIHRKYDDNIDVIYYLFVVQNEHRISTPTTLFIYSQALHRIWRGRKKPRLCRTTVTCARMALRWTLDWWNTRRDIMTTHRQVSFVSFVSQSHQVIHPQFAHQVCHCVI